MMGFAEGFPPPPPTVPVLSVFGRTGAVVAVSGDYTAAKVTNAFDISTSSTVSVSTAQLRMSNAAPQLRMPVQNSLTTLNVFLAQNVEAGSRFHIRADGRIEWCDGTTDTPDVTLARTQAGGIAVSTGKLAFIAGNEQTTVGAAGGASALPLTPTRYFIVLGSDGTPLVIPAYTAS